MLSYPCVILELFVSSVYLATYGLWASLVLLQSNSPSLQPASSCSRSPHKLSDRDLRGSISPSECDSGTVSAHCRVGSGESSSSLHGSGLVVVNQVTPCMDRGRIPIGCAPPTNHGATSCESAEKGGEGGGEGRERKAVEEAAGESR
jgi:hypothetical protein